VHGEHLLFEGRKMSKSSGNVVLVSDVAARGLDPLALRLAFLQNRYRQQVNLTWEGLEAADTMLRRWRARVADWATSPSAPMPADYRARFETVVADDLDMPRALQVMRDVEKDPDLADGARLEFFLHADRVLGLDLAIDIGRQTSIEVPDEVTALAELRAAARAAKDWAESDRLRDAIAELGWTVTDGKEGQQLQR
jgi:cysteinyl-tRNA synthetase